MVSIIMPTYNRGHIIAKAIESVLNQTVHDYELIIVDDGSTDDTYNQIKRFFANIRYFKLEENMGAAYARNYGISHALGEYIAFLDTDNVWHPTFLETRLRDLNEFGVDLTFGRVNIVDGDTKFIFPDNTKEDIRRNLDRIMAFGNLIDTNTVIVRNNCKIKLVFDETMKRFQDWDLFSRLIIDENVSVYFSDDVLTDGYRKPDSISKTVDPFPYKLKIFSKHVNIYREKGYLYDLVYYMINDISTKEDGEAQILSLLKSDDFIGVFGKLKNLNDYLTSYTKDVSLIIKKQNCVIDLMKYWMDRLLKGFKIEKYFKQLDLNNVVIYGYGHLGEMLFKQLSLTSINIKGIFDIDKTKLMGIRHNMFIMHDLEAFRELNDVDGIIVTPIGVEREVDAALSKYTNVKRYFFGELIKDFDV